MRRKKLENWSDATGNQLECLVCSHIITITGHKNDDLNAMKAHGIIEHGTPKAMIRWTQ